MANVACTFSIAESTVGGKLTGGFSAGNILSSGDNLVVSVVYPSLAQAPQSLGGVFVFSAAPGSPSNQSTPSPFVRAGTGNFICLAQQSATAVNGTSTVTYTFAPIPYAGGKQGAYELTFVATNGALQWSEDPEFDTSN